MFLYAPLKSFFCKYCSQICVYIQKLILLAIDERLLCLSILYFFLLKALRLQLLYDEFVLVSKRNVAKERVHAVVNVGNKILTSSSLVSVRIDTIIQGSVR